MKTKKTIVCGFFAVMLALTLVFTDCGSLISIFNTEALEEISGNTNEQSGRTASGTANSGSPAQETQFKFTLINDGTSYSVSKGREISGVVVIPATYNGKPVTEIGSASDDWNNGAFAKTSLTSVTIPSSVTSIGFGAFSGCTSLTSVTIPSSVTSIGVVAFANCTSLTSVTIPSSVTSIGNEAFFDCTSLTSVTIPSSVTSIGDSPFGSCVGLTGITVDSQNPAYSSVDGVLFNKNRTVLIQYPIGKQEKSYTIPSSVTTIGDRAFAVTSLTSVTIPSSVTSIGDRAFFKCTSLTNITIPSGVTSIGEGAFNWCTSLTSITISSSVISIGAMAFDNTSLTSVTMSRRTRITGETVFPSRTRITYSD